MRESGEPDDSLTLSIRHDDIDGFQSIITKLNIDFQQVTIPFNIFDNFQQNGSISAINYSAAFGAVKCFKYLFLNHVKINMETFKYAIYGGNVEIIKITDQFLT